MGKVSIGLRGWRFDEADVFTDDGDLRPVDQMPDDVAARVSRLSALVGSPCHACWLIHGDENLPACNVAAVVYGEPMAEVVLCEEHEPDFLYWYREAGGDQYRGSEAFQDAFFEWFTDGGRAPSDYSGIEHVDTEPESIPDPDIDQDAGPLERPGSERIDLRNLDLDGEDAA